MKPYIDLSIIRAPYNPFFLPFFICLSAYIYIHPSIHLSIYLSVHPSTRLCFICLNVTKKEREERERERERTLIKEERTSATASSFEQRSWKSEKTRACCRAQVSRTGAVGTIRATQKLWKGSACTIMFSTYGFPVKAASTCTTRRLVRRMQGFFEISREKMQSSSSFFFCGKRGIIIRFTQASARSNREVYLSIYIKTEKDIL